MPPFVVLLQPCEECHAKYIIKLDLAIIIDFILDSFSNSNQILNIVRIVAKT